MKISFIVPGRNNLKYFKWSYDSIMKNKGNHEVEICFADDASTDGTWEWVYSESLVNPMLKVMRNEGSARLGHTTLYDALIRRSTHDICIIWHCDMYLAPGALDAIQANMVDKKTIVSLTRVEPPLHPPGHEKITADLGTEPETFMEGKFLELIHNMKKKSSKKEKTTAGVFAPWAFYKEEFLSIGGHDSLFYVQSKEDSDIWNRLMLNGATFVQTWEGFVYHMTCRGSRFNPTITQVGKNSDEWEKQNIISTRNFIRKWGGMPLQNEYHAISPNKKYNIGIIVDMSSEMNQPSDGEFIDFIGFLEIFCDSLHIVGDKKYRELVKFYIDKEQPNTLFYLADRLWGYNYKYTPSDQIVLEEKIVISMEWGKIKVNEVFEFLQKFPFIIENYSPGLYGSDIGTIHIKDESSILKTYEKDLINLNNLYKLREHKEIYPEYFDRYRPVLDFLEMEKLNNNL
jgi:glycosyltransferase involved in cell wall biosynthesis